jgi:hypothetical protein
LVFKLEQVVVLSVFFSPSGASLICTAVWLVEKKSRCEPKWSQCSEENRERTYLGVFFEYLVIVGIDFVLFLRAHPRDTIPTLGNRAGAIRSVTVTLDVSVFIDALAGPFSPNTLDTVLFCRYGSG